MPEKKEHGLLFPMLFRMQGKGGSPISHLSGMFGSSCVPEGFLQCFEFFLEQAARRSI
jgi:hypothetical protein